jgi:hypothetical protein
MASNLTQKETKMKRDIKPMFTLAAIATLSTEGFFVGIQEQSYVVAKDGVTYVFERTQFDKESAKSFAGNMFGLLCDPFLAASVKDPIVSGFKPTTDEEVFEVAVMIEGPVYPLLFIPKEDWDSLFDKAESKRAAQKLAGTNSDSDVTLH